MNKNAQFQKIENISNFINSLISDFCSSNNLKPIIPEYFVVLGSGLGQYAQSEHVKMLFSINYNEIPDFPMSTVEGHKGRFILGLVNGTPVLFMQGRLHYYEGHSIENVVLGVRVAAFLKIKRLIVTNAAGGINTNFMPGDLMIITDHISTFIPSPLRGENIELGTRFPDMSYAYSSTLIEKAEKYAHENNIKIQKGVYLQTPGPQYETPAEVRMMRLLGADAIGMSTACEVIAAKHAGMEVFGMSCITNMAAGIQKEALNHEEVQRIANKAEHNFAKIITHIISN